MFIDKFTKVNYYKRTIKAVSYTHLDVYKRQAHNRRDFIAENVDPDRVQLNMCYRNENLKEVYKELFDEAVER